MDVAGSGRHPPASKRPRAFDNSAPIEPGIQLDIAKRARRRLGRLTKLRVRSSWCQVFYEASRQPRHAELDFHSTVETCRPRGVVYPCFQTTVINSCVAVRILLI